VVVSQTEAWTGATTLTGAPIARESPSAAWTGKEMIVWGGRIALDGTSVNTGAKYDPVTNTWTGTTTTTGAPPARRLHTASGPGRR